MIGICNPNDCPQGYEPHCGWCKEVNGEKLIYKDKDGKFKSEKMRSAMYNIQMAGGFTVYMIKGLTCSTLHLNCEH